MSHYTYTLKQIIYQQIFKHRNRSFVMQAIVCMANVNVC